MEQLIGLYSLIQNYHIFKHISLIIKGKELFTVQW